MVDIYIVSGFLGAGKTTLIQKLLTEAFRGKKVALIENDFGEVSVDAALLKGSGYQVRELNAGCICCTLTGDFVAALASLLKAYHPEVILIEPSGVGKLSDVERACQNHLIATLARVRRKITVVDVKRCESYLENFGEFFEDQLTNADAILLSRTEGFPEKIPAAAAIAAHWNPRAGLFAKRWAEIPAEELLTAGALAEREPAQAPHGHCRRDCDCHGEHNHSAHTAPEAFDTLTLRFHHPLRISDIADRLSALEQSECGGVLRAKGILKSAEGFLNLQYLPGDLKIERTDVSGNELCIIGKDLDEGKITALFRGIGG